MLRSVTLLGSSSGRNAGDAALMSGIMDTIDAACGRRLLYEIPTIRPNFVWDNYENRVRPIGLLPWNLAVKIFGVPTYQSVTRADLSLIFDAVLFDRALYNPLFNFLSTFSVILPHAKRKGKKLGMFNVGIGPVDSSRGREMLLDVAEMMDFITVRDQDSYDILRDIGVKNRRVLVTADAALNVRGPSEARINEIFHVLGLDPSEEILAINVNSYLDSWAGSRKEPLTRDKFIATYAAALDRVLKELGHPVLFVVTQHGDLQITREVMARLSSLRRVALVSNLQYSHYDIIGVLSKVSMLFAMRLHAMILASSSCTPVLGLAYQPKCQHYFNTLDLKPFCMSFDDYSEEGIVAHLRKGWEGRMNIRKCLEKQIPRLKSEAHRAAEIVSKLDRGESLDQFFTPEKVPSQGASGRTHSLS